MGNFFDRVRNGEVAGPRKREFTLESWRSAFERGGSTDKVDEALYRSGIHIHTKLGEIRRVLAASSTTSLSNETRRVALVALANREFHTIERLMLEQLAAHREASSTDLHVRDLTRIQIKTADGRSYDAQSVMQSMIDGIAFPLRAALAKSRQPSTVDISAVNWADISLEMNLGNFYDQAENLWEDCLWNGYVIVGSPQTMLALPTDLSAKRGERASATRKVVLGLESMAYAEEVFRRTQAIGISPRIKRITDIHVVEGQQRIVVGDDAPDPRSHSMLHALRDLACPPYFDSMIEEPHEALGGLSLSQLFDGWQVISLSARHLWESASKERLEVDPSGQVSSVDLRGFVPHLSKKALVTAIVEAADIPAAGAHALIDFLTFRGRSNQQLWSQPLVSVCDDDKLYPVAGVVVSPPSLRYVLELWMAQVGVDFEAKGSAFERHLRARLVEAASASAMLSSITRVIRGDFKFTCADGQFAQFDGLFCIGSAVFVMEAKCILEPSGSSSIGTHRRAIERAAVQAMERIDLIEQHRGEFIERMHDFDWQLPTDFTVHPLIAVSTFAHVGVPCNGIPVVDELVLMKFFDGSYEDVGLSTNDFSVVHRINHPFYSSPEEAERTASEYFAAPPQLRQYVESLSVIKVPIYAVSEDDWGGTMIDFE